jgi:hypothetical protein
MASKRQRPEILNHFVGALSVSIGDLDDAKSAMLAETLGELTIDDALTVESDRLDIVDKRKREIVAEALRSLDPYLDEVDEVMMNELTMLDMLHGNVEAFERAMQVWVARAIVRVERPE